MEYEQGTMPNSFPDWFGIPGSPRANEATLDLGDATCSVDNFNMDIDSMDTLVDLPFNAYFDWSEIFNNSGESAAPLGTPSAPSEEASSTHWTGGPPSPFSETTLVDFSSQSSDEDVKSTLFDLPWSFPLVLAHSPTSYFDVGGIEPYNPSPPIYQSDLPFTFECIPSMTLDVSSSPSTMSYKEPFLAYSDGLPILQHETNAAGSDVHGVFQGVEMKADFELSFPSPTLDLAAEDDLAPAKTKVKRCKSSSTKRRLAKRRPPQDRTPKYACEICGKKFARSNNRNVHVDSVHFEMRKYRCTHWDCERSFSRNYDLQRHITSKHTPHGSPRRKDEDEYE